MKKIKIIPLVEECPYCHTNLHCNRNVYLNFLGIDYWKCHICEKRFSTRIEEWSLSNIIFHPLLWSFPFVILIAINFFQIFQYGIIDARQPFIEYRQFHSFNVVLFSMLWIYGLFKFNKLGFKGAEGIWLSFTLLFATYGFGEVIAHIFWAPLKIHYYGIVSHIINFGYPLFFVFNIIPLLKYLKVKKPSKYFFYFLVLSFVSYVATFRLDMIRRGPLDWAGLWYETSWWRIPADITYFVARTFSVLAYIHLIRGIKNKK